MDVDDFVMPSPKRQRTESPHETLLPVATTNPQMTEEKDEERPIQAGSDHNEILDALMQHVESEAMPDVTTTATKTIELVEDVAYVTAEKSIDTTGKELSSSSAVQSAVSTKEHVDDTHETRNNTIAAAPVPSAEPQTASDSVPSIDPQIPLSNNAIATDNLALLVDGIPLTEEIEQMEGEGQPEWEVDSSPYDSSTDSDSTDSSSDDSDEDEDADGDYAMLDPEEAARILMQGDAGSDDEGDKSKNKGEGSSLRTANEQVEDVPPIPDIAITEDMKIEELGTVEAIVENNILIKGKTSGEYQVLESGSLLCLPNRKIAGIVAETLGRVEQPLYTIRFRTEQDIIDRGISEKGTVVYYVPQHSSFVFTVPLKGLKGSDASNFHDEEVGDEEMEFSDDEAEAEHKRQLKAKRQGRSGDTSRGRGGSTKGGRGGQRGGGGYKPSPLSTDSIGAAYGNGSLEMNYDDVEDGEEGYTPLARPANLHTQPQSSEGANISHMPPPPFSDRGRGSRGHNHRGGRERGGRGGGRGNFRNNHNHNSSRNNTNSYHQQNSPTTPQYPNPFSNNQFPQQYPYAQSGPHSAGHSNQAAPPSAPSLTPQNPSYPYSVVTSPMSPLPKQQYNFAAGNNNGFQFHPPPPGMSQPYGNQIFQQQSWSQPQQQQMPGGFAAQFSNPAMMQFAQQFQQQQQQQQNNNNNGSGASGWQINQAAAAEVQRQLEEMRRAAQ